jgi:hypothetical protein
MNTTARVSALIGAGLLAGVLAAPPAQAAPVSPPHITAVGYFMNQIDCEWVGAAGEHTNHWTDSHCLRVNRGPHRGMYLLTVEGYTSTGHGGPTVPGHPA